MLFRIYLVRFIFILSSFINNQDMTTITNNNHIKDSYNNQDIIMKIKIPKINLDNNIYNINDKHNNVEENVTILKESSMPDQNNSKVILAAHSGPTDYSYFDRLDELKINDLLYLKYKNKTYIYQIYKIYETKKNGSIYINKSNDKELVLTTCSKRSNNLQLIVLSKIKKEE